MDCRQVAFSFAIPRGPEGLTGAWNSRGIRRCQPRRMRQEIYESYTFTCVALIGMALAILQFLALFFAQGSSPGSIRSDVFTKGTNGELAVLPGAQLVLRGTITRETESDAEGAFAIDSLPPGTYELEANALGLYVALAVEVSVGASSTFPVEVNMAAVTSTTPTQLTRLKAMDCAFSRKVHHA